MLTDHRRFDTTKRYYVRRAFTFAGVRYNVGDRFDVRGIQLRASQLFNMGRIAVDDRPEPAMPPAAPSRPRTIVSQGGGWFVVMDADGTRLTPTAVRRDEAERIASEG